MVVPSSDDRFLIRMFGPIEVEYQGRRIGPTGFGGLKAKQILEILLLRRGHPVTKEQLAEELWTEEERPVNVPATLETYVSVLRRSLDPDGCAGRTLIRTEPGAYRLAADLVDLDLDRFDALCERASLLDATRALELLAEALSLVRGDVLEDEPYAGWSERVRDRYRQRWLDARLMAAELAMTRGAFDEALHHAADIVEAEPLHEPAYRVQMIASYALGRQDRALRVYARCRDTLDAELGVEPVEETSAVLDGIRRHAALGVLLDLHMLGSTLAAS